MQIEAFMYKAQCMHQNDPTMRNLYRSEGARLLLSNPEPGSLLHQRLLMINNLLEQHLACPECQESAPTLAALLPRSAQA
jgi:hypothetical protein